MRLLHARAGRVGSGARGRESQPDSRRDPPYDGRQHLPLRHLSANRGGDPALARLIRTEKEVEGRFEEVWLVVEEDPLTQWPAGPLTVVGRDAVRQDAPERVRGEARYTADIQLPGMLHAAILRSPYAHARATHVDFAKALALPGVRAALGPGEAKGLEVEAGLARGPVAAVAAETEGQARAALASVE